MGTLELLQVPFKATKKDQKVCCLKDTEGQQMAEAGRRPVRGHLGGLTGPGSTTAEHSMCREHDGAMCRFSARSCKQVQVHCRPRA